MTINDRLGNINDEYPEIRIPQMEINSKRILRALNYCMKCKSFNWEQLNRAWAYINNNPYWYKELIIPGSIYGTILKIQKRFSRGFNHREYTKLFKLLTVTDSRSLKYDNN